MSIRDRIRELRRVPAKELRPNPRNWRLHPPEQEAALKALLAEVGYAGALIARELDDGSLELIDGHLRAETTPDQVVPVLVLDVSEAEAAKLLATFDRLSAAAQADFEKLRGLLAEIDFAHPAVETLFAELRSHASQHAAQAASAEPAEIYDVFQVLVECANEAEQRELFESLTALGKKCRLVGGVSCP